MLREAAEEGTSVLLCTLPGFWLSCAWSHMAWTASHGQVLLCMDCNLVVMGPCAS